MNSTEMETLILRSKVFLMMEEKINRLEKINMDLLDAHEGLISENVVKSAVITQISKQNAALLEAANKAKKMIEDNFLQSVIARDTLASLNEAIAQAELRP